MRDPSPIIPVIPEPVDPPYVGPIVAPLNWSRFWDLRFDVWESTLKGNYSVETYLNSMRSGNLTFHSDGHTTMKSGDNYFDV